MNLVERLAANELDISPTLVKTKTRAKSVGLTFNRCTQTGLQRNDNVGINLKCVKISVFTASTAAKCSRNEL